MQEEKERKQSLANSVNFYYRRKDGQGIMNRVRVENKQDIVIL